MRSHLTRPFLALSVFVFAPGLALAADPPAPAEVLSKLHESNLKEVEMGKLAQKQGQSKEVKAFGKTLVQDHTAADKKVKALAKQEKAQLSAEAPAMKHEDLGTGAEFDTKFAQSMLEDHNKDIEEVKSARDATNDPKLKALLDELVPTLEKHRDTAQKLAGSSNTGSK
jgi:putative membrane protein